MYILIYTAMVKDPFKEWDGVDTFCTLLVDLGSQNINKNFANPIRTGIDQSKN